LHSSSQFLRREKNGSLSHPIYDNRGGGGKEKKKIGEKKNFNHLPLIVSLFTWERRKEKTQEEKGNAHRISSL